VQLETAILIGVLFACATYLILQRSFIKILFGFVVLSNAANLLVLCMSGRPDGKAPPIVVENGVPMVDPLPQALILTAIVIGFGVTSYLVILLYRIFLDQETTNLEELYRPSSVPEEALPGKGETRPQNRAEDRPRP
jgi:multicomponent Na+:H+ antiporter subunit C